MKKYIITDHSTLVELSGNSLEDLKVSTARHTHMNVDYNWIIDEDSEIVFNNKTYQVKANSVVYTLYRPSSMRKDGEINRELCIVHAPELCDAVRRINKAYENECKPCCDECCNAVTQEIA